MTFSSCPRHRKNRTKPKPAMADFRRAQSQAHPAKTNVLSVGLISLLILVISLQIWLLSASANTALGGDKAVAWPAFYASLVLLIAGSVALRCLPQPIRLALVVEKPQPFANAALTWRTLGISVVALALSFSVWFMRSAITVKLNDCGCNLSKRQLFWLTATPVILGSLLRMPYGLLVSRFGSRRSHAGVTLLMLLPALGTGFAVQNPHTPYDVLLFWSALTGIAGANFATSMAAVALWFPKQLQGSALGINGLGNLGLTIAQFTVPVMLGIAFLGHALPMQLPSEATRPVFLQKRRVRLGAIPSALRRSVLVFHARFSDAAEDARLAAPRHARPAHLDHFASLFSDLRLLRGDERIAAAHH